jgi:hypothetical protein
MEMIMVMAMAMEWNTRRMLGGCQCGDFEWWWDAVVFVG